MKMKNDSQSTTPFDSGVCLLIRLLTWTLSGEGQFLNVSLCCSHHVAKVNRKRLTDTKKHSNVRDEIFECFLVRNYLVVTLPGILRYKPASLGKISKLIFPSSRCFIEPCGVRFQRMNSQIENSPDTRPELFSMVISPGIEPGLPGWKPGVLTVRRWDRSDGITSG